MLLVVHAVISLGFTIDDAYITFTVARNLAQGYGPVFVRGEAVEATSSMLWAVLLAPFELFFSRDGAVIGSKILGMLSLIGVLVAGTAVLRHIIDERRVGTAPGVVFSVLLALSSPFVVWSVYGLEHGLVALLLLLAVGTFLREIRTGRGYASALWIVLLQTARPEGFMFILVFIIVRILHARLEGTRMNTFDHRVWYALILTMLVAYEAAGLWYFGELLPNTVYAKMRGFSISKPLGGLRYALYPASWIFTALYLFTVPALLLRILAARPMAMRRRVRRSIPQLLIAALLTTQGLFIVGTGGDWMPNARFFSHVIPLLLVLVVSLASEARIAIDRSTWGTSLRSSRRLMLAGGLLLFIAMNIHTAIDTRRGQRLLQTAEDRAITGMAILLNATAQSDTGIVACADVGRMGYYFAGRVFDWWGLANREVARRGQSFGRIVPDLVYRHTPEYLILYSNDSLLTPGSMHSDMARNSRAFYQHAEFRHYHHITSRLFWPGRWHVLLGRVEAGTTE